MSDAIHEGSANAASASRAESARRWRLLLGTGADDDGVALGPEDKAMDAALGALYDNAGEGGEPSPKDNSMVGMGASAPRVARWLGDIRRYFPTQVVQVMQADAIDRLALKRLLLEPEMLATVEPDVHLVGTLVGLRKLLPEQTMATARLVVRKVTDQVEARIADRLRVAVRGALSRASRTRRPRPGDLDLNRTIRANLRNYLPQRKTIVPDRLIGYGRRQTGFQREIVLCVDQSGSMASSVVYASVFAAVLAGIRALRTHLVAYDTAVVDLTDQLGDPVDVVFGTQLGGGNDTPRALAYCQQLITRPRDTVLLLISDLYEGEGSVAMIRRLAEFKASGVRVVVLLALDDDGTPSFEQGNAAQLAGLGIPAFACTPDAFPDLIAEAIAGGDVAAWAAAGNGRSRS